MQEALRVALDRGREPSASLLTEPLEHAAAKILRSPPVVGLRHLGLAGDAFSAAVAAAGVALVVAVALRVARVALLEQALRFALAFEAVLAARGAELVRGFPHRRARLVELLQELLGQARFALSAAPLELAEPPLDGPLPVRRFAQPFSRFFFRGRSFLLFGAFRPRELFGDGA